MFDCATSGKDYHHYYYEKKGIRSWGVMCLIVISIFAHSFAWLSRVISVGSTGLHELALIVIVGGVGGRGGPAEHGPGKHGCCLGFGDSIPGVDHINNIQGLFLAFRRGNRMAITAFTSMDDSDLFGAFNIDAAFHR